MSETRNIIDYYHYWETEAIKADLDKKRNNFSILISNLYNDFNIGSVIRNSNAFLASNVFYFGSKKFDNRGAVGTNHYENLIHIPSIEEIKNTLNSHIHSDYTLIGMDNIDGSEAIDTFFWPQDQHVVMCFGQEQVGLPDEIVSMCNELVYIRQFGSVRSLNVGCASAIAMYDYCSKMA